MDITKDVIDSVNERVRAWLNTSRPERWFVVDEPTFVRLREIDQLPYQQVSTATHTRDIDDLRSWSGPNISQAALQQTLNNWVTRTAALDFRAEIRHLCEDGRGVFSVAPTTHIRRTGFRIEMFVWTHYRRFRFPALAVTQATLAVPVQPTPPSTERQPRRIRLRQRAEA